MKTSFIRSFEDKKKENKTQVCRDSENKVSRAPVSQTMMIMISKVFGISFFLVLSTLIQTNVDGSKLFAYNY
jgi:hypothetical protein